MILAFVLFGLFCVVGSFIVCLIFGMATGNLIGVKVKGVKPKLQISNPLPLKAKVKEVSKKYFIKLGKNKVPIEKNEVTKAKADGYEILIE